MSRIRISHRAEQLEKVLEARIRQGRYPPASRMPPERQVATELGYARHTVRKAYQALDHRGLLGYKGRTWHVAEDLGTVEWQPAKGRRKSYALMLHMSALDKGLYAAMEKAIRRAGAMPVGFDLEYMDLADGRMDLMGHLHFKVEGVFFLNSVYGNARRDLEKRMLEAIPHPWLFVDDEPAFATPRVIGADPEECARKLLQHARDGRYAGVDLCFPWPLREREAQLLHRVSCAAAEPGVKASFAVHFLGPQADALPRPQGPRSLLVLGPRLFRLAGKVAEGREALVLGGPAGGVLPGVRCPAELLAQKAFQAMRRGLEHLNGSAFVSPGLVQPVERER